jgi:hypothetical protein
MILALDRKYFGTNITVAKAISIANNVKKKMKRVFFCNT